jgi:hypothetical protein
MEINQEEHIKPYFSLAWVKTEKKLGEQAYNKKIIIKIIIRFKLPRVQGYINFWKFV